MLVTCTDGRCGDGPGGVKPGEPGHDPEAVVAIRRAELAGSCEALKVTYHQVCGHLMGLVLMGVRLKVLP